MDAPDPAHDLSGVPRRGHSADRRQLPHPGAAAQQGDHRLLCDGNGTDSHQGIKVHPHLSGGDDVGHQPPGQGAAIPPAAAQRTRHRAVHPTATAGGDPLLLRDTVTGHLLSGTPDLRPVRYSARHQYGGHQYLCRLPDGAPERRIRLCPSHCGLRGGVLLRAPLLLYLGRDDLPHRRDPIPGGYGDERDRQTLFEHRNLRDRRIRPENIKAVQVRHDIDFSGFREKPQKS